MDSGFELLALDGERWRRLAVGEVPQQLIHRGRLHRQQYPSIAVKVQRRCNGDFRWASGIPDWP